MAELVDAPDLGSGGENRGGSSPSARTKVPPRPSGTHETIIAAALLPHLPFWRLSGKTGILGLSGEVKKVTLKWKSRKQTRKD